MSLLAVMHDAPTTITAGFVVVMNSRSFSISPAFLSCKIVGFMPVDGLLASLFCVLAVSAIIMNSNFNKPINSPSRFTVMQITGSLGSGPSSTDMTILVFILYGPYIVISFNFLYPRLMIFSFASLVNLSNSSLLNAGSMNVNNASIQQGAVGQINQRSKRENHQSRIQEIEGNHNVRSIQNEDKNCHVCTAWSRTQ